MLRDVINELFFMIAGIYLFISPFSSFLGNTPGYTVGNLLLCSIGAVFLMSLLLTYTVGFRFDKKFKKVLLADKDLAGKLPLSFVSADWYMTLRVVRATMYARNIVLPKGTKKNWIQESWFHGYDFRKHARWFEIIISYIYFILLIIMVVYGAAIGVYQLFTNQHGF